MVAASRITTSYGTTMVKMAKWSIMLSYLMGCLTHIAGVPYPYPYPYAMPFQMQYAMPNPYAVPAQYRFPIMGQRDVIGQRRDGGVSSNPGKAPSGNSGKEGKPGVVYAPYPGEIVLKLIQNWDSNLLDMTSPEFQILEGNLRSAVQAVMGPMTQVTNIYFREGYVPGNPPSRPKTVGHMMVNGGSDAASVLERAVTPDGSLGDGLKVYKDSFNAY